MELAQELPYEGCSIDETIRRSFRVKPRGSNPHTQYRWGAPWGHASFRGLEAGGAEPPANQTSVVGRSRRRARRDGEVDRVVVGVVAVRQAHVAVPRARRGRWRRSRRAPHEGVDGVAIAERVDDRSVRVAERESAARRGKAAGEALVRGRRACVVAAAEEVEGAGRQRRAGWDRGQADVPRAGGRAVDQP